MPEILDRFQAYLVEICSFKVLSFYTELFVARGKVFVLSVADVRNQM